MVLKDAISGLTGALQSATTPIKMIAAMGDKFTQAGASLGMSFEQTFDSFDNSVQSLRGSLDQRFSANIRTLEAGLQGNTKGVARLINQQELTNTSFARTASTMANLESTLSLSRDDTNNLAEGLIDTGSMYQISTDKLVNAVDALKDTFPAQAIAGLGPGLMGAVTQLQAELGPQLSGSLNKMMKMILDTSQDGYDKLVRLGIGDVREKLMAAADDQDKSAAILRSAAVVASNNFKDLASGPFHMIGVASQHLGQGAISFTSVADNLGKREEKAVAAVDMFAKSIAVMKKELFIPIERMMLKVYPLFQESMSTLSDIAHILGEEFNKIVDGLGGEFGFKGAVKTVQSSLVEFAITLVKATDGIFDSFSFFEPGGGFDRVKVGFVNIIARIQELPFIGDKSAAKELRSSISDEISAIASKNYVENLLKNPPMSRDEIGAVMARKFLNLGDDKFSVMRRLSLEEEERRLNRDRDLYEEALKKQEKDGKFQDGVIQKLETLLRNIEEGTNYDRNNRDDEREDRIRTRESVESLAEAERQKTSSGFLDSTAAMLGASMESILGIGPTNPFESLKESVEEQTEVLLGLGLAPTNANVGSFEPY